MAGSSKIVKEAASKQTKDKQWDNRHNTCPYLDPTSKNATEFAEVINFLKGSRIYEAISHKCPIYISHHKQFWETAVLLRTGDDQDEEVIRGTVGKFEVSITEEVIRKTLKIHDSSEDPIELPKHQVQGCLKRMGYVGRVDTPSVHKAGFPKQFKYLAHVLLHSMGHKKGGYDLLNEPIVHMMVALVLNLEFNFSRVLFNYIKDNESSRKFWIYPRYIQKIIDSQVSKLPRVADDIMVLVRPRDDTLKQMKMVRKVKPPVDVPLFGAILKPDYKVAKGKWKNPDSEGEEDGLEEVQVDTPTQRKGKGKVGTSRPTTRSAKTSKGMSTQKQEEEVEHEEEDKGGGGEEDDESEHPGHVKAIVKGRHLLIPKENVMGHKPIENVVIPEPLKRKHKDIAKTRQKTKLIRRRKPELGDELTDSEETTDEREEEEDEDLEIVKKELSNEDDFGDDDNEDEGTKMTESYDPENLPRGSTIPPPPVYDVGPKVPADAQMVIDGISFEEAVGVFHPEGHATGMEVSVTVLQVSGQAGPSVLKFPIQPHMQKQVPRVPPPLSTIVKETIPDFGTPSTEAPEQHPEDELEKTSTINIPEDEPESSKERVDMKMILSQLEMLERESVNAKRKRSKDRKMMKKLSKENKALTRKVDEVSKENEELKSKIETMEALVEDNTGHGAKTNKCTNLIVDKCNEVVASHNNIMHMLSHHEDCMDCQTGKILDIEKVVLSTKKFVFEEMLPRVKWTLDQENARQPPELKRFASPEQKKVARAEVQEIETLPKEPLPKPTEHV